MHRAALLLLVACSAGSPAVRIEPRPWSRGTRLALSVGLPDEHRGYEAQLGRFATMYEKALRSDLQAAGFEIADAAELRLKATAPSHLQTNPITSSRALLSFDGVEIDRVEVDGRSLDCFAFWSWSYGNEESNAACVSRSVVAQLLESTHAPKAQEIAARSRPAPAAVAPIAAATPILAGKLAVLELRLHTRELTKQNGQYFTDLVRAAALKALPRVTVITRENLLVLLEASGKSLESCEGECEVDTGRRIGADAIVSGEIQKLGSLFKLTLRLHDTREGRLLASTQASGKTVEELDTGAQRAAAELFERK